MELQKVSGILTARPVSFGAGEKIGDVCRNIEREPAVYKEKEYPVLSADGEFIGMVPHDHIVQMGQSAEEGNRKLCLLVHAGASVSQDATVMSAMHCMLETNLDSIAVVNREDKLVGIVTKPSILAAGKFHLEEETRKERFIHLFRTNKLRKTGKRGGSVSASLQE